MSIRFNDRREAGELLARKLQAYADRRDVVVLGLPRGGVPVAYEVARSLHAPLDVFVVRKLGVPGHEEFAMGAIASGGARVLNQILVRQLGISNRDIEEVIATEQRELERREREYRGDVPFIDVRDRVVILVDDGLATGASMSVAVAALRRERPAKIVVASPVASTDAMEVLCRAADDCVFVVVPHDFRSVGVWYVNFAATTDDEVQDFLARSLTPMLDGAATLATM